MRRSRTWTYQPRHYCEENLVIKGYGVPTVMRRTAYITLMPDNTLAMAALLRRVTLDPARDLDHTWGFKGVRAVNSKYTLKHIAGWWERYATEWFLESVTP